MEEERAGSRSLERVGRVILGAAAALVVLFLVGSATIVEGLRGAAILLMNPPWTAVHWVIQYWGVCSYGQVAHVGSYNGADGSVSYVIASGLVGIVYMAVPLGLLWLLVTLITRLDRRPPNVEKPAAARPLFFGAGALFFAAIVLLLVVAFVGMCVFLSSCVSAAVALVSWIF